MAWNITPAQAAAIGVNALNDPRFVDQFAYAIAERLQALGAPAPFPQNHEWDSFHIDSVVDNGDGTITITDGSKAWMTSPRHRWIDAIPGTDPGVPAFAPTSYDAVIDADRTGTGLSEPDQRTVIQAVISDQPSATQLKLTFDADAAVRERRLASVAALAGRNGWIIKRAGLNYTRGFVRWPNARHYAYGVVDSAVWDDPANPVRAIVTLRVSREFDAADQTGREAVFRDGLGRIQRGAIFSADTRKLVLTGITALPLADGELFVIKPGGYWQWGREGGPVQAAHGGLTTPYYTHAVDPGAADGVTTVGVPRLTYPVLYGQDPLSCPIFPTDELLRDDADGLDVDLYIPYDNQCGAGDIYVQPNWHQTWRGRWCMAYRAAVGFVKPISFDGAGAIPQLSYATWLNYSGVNGYSATAGTHSGTTLPVALGVPHTPVNLWWSVIGSDGSLLISGFERDYDGSTINGAFSAAHDGRLVIASVGPDRLLELAFAVFDPVTYFLPDIVAGSPVLPPTDANPGTFLTLQPSTHYLVSDRSGQVGDSTIARHAIADGHYARFAGHRFHDPGFPVRLPADVADPSAPYHNDGFVGARQPAVEGRINAAMSGTASGGSHRRIVVTGMDFDALDFMPATNGCTHSFTAASGSTTGCTVPGVGGLWGAGRFPGFAGPFVGYCVEFLMSGSSFTDPAAVVERRPIATGTSGGVITWEEPTGGSVNGLPGRIVEPRRLNPFKGLPVELRKPDGTVAVVKVEASHGDTIFIPDPGFAVDATTTYRITRRRICDVYKRVSGAWVATSDMGPDPRYPGSTFRHDASLNMGDVRREFGLPLPTDLTFGGLVGPQQLYDAINVLKVSSVGGGSWIETTANLRRGSGVPNSTYAGWRDSAINGPSPLPPGFNDYFNFAVRDGSGPPEAFYDVTKDSGTSFAYAGSVVRRVNKWRLSGIASPFPSSLDYYDYADTVGNPATDPDVIFDANGDAVAYQAWKLWSTKAAAAGVNQVDSDRLGPNVDAVPNDDGGPSLLPPTTPPTGHRWAGYVVTNAVALRTWSFKFM